VSVLRMEFGTGVMFDQEIVFPLFFSLWCFAVSSFYFFGCVGFLLVPWAWAGCSPSQDKVLYFLSF
jgi:hypothetical protein